MTEPAARRITETLERTRDLMDASLRDPALLDAIERAAARLTETLRRGDKLLIAGNGGSAADAQHIAGEIVGRFLFDRAPLAAIALTTDSSILTAVANDYGFDEVYARQIRGLGRPGDLFLGISTSGNSPSILNACATAREMGLGVLGLTGAGGGRVARLCDIAMRVPSERTFMIQQVHITIGHILCLLAEAEIFGAAPPGMTDPGPKPAVFFDRDGVINEDRGYVGEASRFVFLPGAVAGVRAANRRGALAFLVTNQSGVARGYYTEADVAALHAHMVREMARDGARFDEIRYCPHLPEAPIEAYRRDCDCRKPKPGMIRDLLAHWPADPTRSVLIGDKTSDMHAARAAGIRGVLCGGEPLDRVVEAFLDEMA